MKYKVGDRVIIKERRGGHCFDIGETVEIVQVNSYDYVAKSNVNGQWWVVDKELAPIKKTDEIHITTNGRYTYAVKKHNGKVVARAEAKCHEDDEFDFNIGVNLCLERLGVGEAETSFDADAKHFEVGNIVKSSYYTDFEECVIVKIEDDDNVWVTPLGHDDYTRDMARNYMINGFIEHETAYHTNMRTLTKMG